MLSPKFLVAIASFVTISGIAFGQEGPPPGQEVHRPNDGRPDFLAQLGLTPEQIQQFRRLNMEHRPVMNEAQKRLRETNRDLDIAIYADVVSDDMVYTRIKAFQEAQAEVNRLRFGHELAIRKILTHEQLVRFREMRRRFAETRQQNQRQNLMPRRDMAPQQRRLLDNQKRPTI
jgi:Spy/CpxP family protein refolding chaperone